MANNNEDIKISEEPLDETFWNNRYITQNLGWDLGEVSPPLKNYIDHVSDKNVSILIPGCGNCYEAEYLLQQGFTNITIIDIAPDLVDKLQHKYASYNNLKIIHGDFFDHSGNYDLILEQTFFCALNPLLRKAYAIKMNSLLSTHGKLVGVLFDTIFEKEGPPFGGTKTQYLPIFESEFFIQTFEPCYNSFPKRQGTELFVILRRK